MNEFEKYTELLAQLTLGDRPVIAEFSTPSCQPCLLQDRLVDAASFDLGNKAELVKVDLTEHPVLADNFAVKSVPTVLVLKEGHVSARFADLIDRGTLVCAVERA